MMPEPQGRRPRPPLRPPRAPALPWELGTPGGPGELDFALPRFRKCVPQEPVSGLRAPCFVAEAHGPR